MSDTAVLLARCDAALEGVPRGPWRACGEERGGCQCGIVWAADEETPILCVSSGVDDAPRLTDDAIKEVALFVAAARTLLPELRDHLRDTLVSLKACEKFWTEVSTIPFAEELAYMRGIGPDPDPRAKELAQLRDEVVKLRAKVGVTIGVQTVEPGANSVVLSFGEYYDVVNAVDMWGKELKRLRDEVRRLNETDWVKTAFGLRSDVEGLTAERDRLREQVEIARGALELWTGGYSKDELCVIRDRPCNGSPLSVTVHALARLADGPTAAAPKEEERK